MKEITISVAILDEAQSYELDQVLAITASPGLGEGRLATLVVVGDPHQVVPHTWPQWAVPRGSALRATLRDPQRRRILTRRLRLAHKHLP